MLLCSGPMLPPAWWYTIRLASSAATIAAARRARPAFRSAHWSRADCTPSMVSGFMSSLYPVALWLIEYITTDGWLRAART